MIRLAHTKDAFQIAQVHVESWYETYKSIVREEILEQLSVDQKMSIWEIVIDDPHQAVFVYEEHGRILGFADFYFAPNAEIGELRAIYLLNEIHGRGVGSALMQQGFKLFKERNYKLINVEVFDRNSSRFFYEKLEAYLVGEENADDYGDGLNILKYQWLI